MRRTWTPILILLTAMLAALAAGNGLAAEEAASSATIEKWIEQLDSDMYIERERATIALERVGVAAIAALAEAADGKRLEVATRAVRVLHKYGEGEDQTLSLAALESLASLKNRRVAREAAEEKLGAIREERAVAEILRLGGVSDDRFTLGSNAPEIFLKLGENWKGGDDGLEYINDLRSLERLNIHDTPVGDAGLARLAGLERLTNIELFGTKVTSAGVDSLLKALPNVTVVHHRVFLGVQGNVGPKVQGNVGPKGAVINAVVPGSTAEKAGLQPGDIITKFEGQEVTDFLSLTAHIAGRKAGDTVVIEVKRGDQVLMMEITF